MDEARCSPCLRCSGCVWVGVLMPKGLGGLAYRLGMARETDELQALLRSSLEKPLEAFR